MKIISIFLTFFTITLIAALPKEVQLDNYIKKAKSLTKLSSHEGAYDYYQKAKDLNIKLPEDFYYHYGYSIFRLKAHTLSKKASWKDAKEAFEIYLASVGEKGEHFEDAIMGLHYMKEAEKLDTGCNKNNDLKSCVKLVAFLSGEVKEKFLYKLCDKKKNASSCKILGKYYIKLKYHNQKKGNYNQAKKHLNQAKKIYKKACKLGHDDACKKARELQR